MSSNPHAESADAVLVAADVVAARSSARHPGGVARRRVRRHRHRDGGCAAPLSDAPARHPTARGGPAFGGHLRHAAATAADDADPTSRSGAGALPAAVSTAGSSAPPRSVRSGGRPRPGVPQRTGTGHPHRRRSHCCATAPSTQASSPPMVAGAEVTAAAQAQLASVTPDRKPQTVELDGLGRYRLIALHARHGGETIVTGLAHDRRRRTLLWVRRHVLRRRRRSRCSLRPPRASFSSDANSRRSHGLPRPPANVADLELDRGEVRLPNHIVRVDPAAAHTEVGQLGSALNRMLDRIAGALSARHASETRVRRSSPTPATSCAPRWPRSAATPNWRNANGTNCPTTWHTR